ncbi:hypothetical protein COK10_19885 [Bacillus anthracis]|nr:hypothetical protein COK10_19885 [Bacillus anthracis]
MSFGKLMRERREEKGLSLTSLAKACEVSVSYILRLEKDENRMPSYLVAMRIAKILDITSEEINESFGVEALESSNNYIKIDEENSYLKEAVVKLISIKRQAKVDIQDVIELLQQVEKFVNTEEEKKV